MKSSKYDCTFIVDHLTNSGLLDASHSEASSIFGVVSVSLKPRKADDIGATSVAYVNLDDMTPHITDSDVRLVQSHIIAGMDAGQAKDVNTVTTRQALAIYALRQADTYLTRGGA